MHGHFHDPELILSGKAQVSSLFFAYSLPLPILCLLFAYSLPLPILCLFFARGSDVVPSFDNRMEMQNIRCDVHRYHVLE